MISFIIRLLMETKGLISCWMLDIPFYLLPLCTVFAYQLCNSQKSYRGTNVSYLDTAESHLECNVLLPQLNCYEKRFNTKNLNNPSYYVYLWKLMVWLQKIDYVLCTAIEASKIPSTCVVLFLLPSASALGDITLIPGFNYTLLHI